MAMQQPTYPVQFSVDYPDRSLNRVTTAFRIFVAIPILIVLGAVSGGSWITFSTQRATYVVAAAGGLLFEAPVLRYPLGIVDFVQGFVRWANRVAAYAFLLVTDTYPPFTLSA